MGELLVRGRAQTWRALWPSNSHCNKQDPQTHQLPRARVLDKTKMYEISTVMKMKSSYLHIEPEVTWVLKMKWREPDTWSSPPTREFTRFCDL